MAKVKVTWGSMEKEFEVAEGPKIEAFGVGQSWQYSIDFVLYRYRNALKIQARWKAVVVAYASRYPEFARINAASRRKGVSIREQFRELVRYERDRAKAMRKMWATSFSSLDFGCVVGVIVTNLLQPFDEQTSFS